jgi:hypothetical protein
MARRSRSRHAAAVAVVLVFVAGASTSAHRRDEYLQAARVAIDPARVRIELDLTPGISVAANVLGQVDRDGDGAISRAEGEAYVSGLVSAIRLDVDGRPLSVQPIESAFPAIDAVRTGEGTIRIALSAPLPELDAGAHHVTFRNAHRRDIGVYLANALVPGDSRIAITALVRDAEQHDLVIDYLLRADGTARIGNWWLVAAAGLLLAVTLLCYRGVSSVARRTLVSSTGCDA